MTKSEAKSFKNFGWKEKSIYGTRIFKNYEVISYPFMEWVDDMVSFAKSIYGDRAKFIVYDINLLKHSEHSYHYNIDGHLSMAIDGFFKDLSFQEAYPIISKFRFSGVGVYPDWHPTPGWHLDARPAIVAVYWSAKKVLDKQVYDYRFEKFIEVIFGD